MAEIGRWLDWREENVRNAQAQNDGNEGSNFSWWIFLENLLKIGAGADVLNLSD